VLSTGWEICVDSVKPLRFQLLEIREALLQVVESDKDPLKSSEAKSLAENELLALISFGGNNHLV
jgi:hypothetical protein